jgi:hypothetical protein
VTEGSIKIKLAPPRSDKYLYTYKDYENFEFRSPVNAWNVQQQYRPDFDKIKCLEVVVKKGQIIFIPAFWWNTMRFEEDASVCVFKYKTYMNTVAMIPQLFMRFLQSNNVKRNIISNKAASTNITSIANTNIIPSLVTSTTAIATPNIIMPTPIIIEANTEANTEATNNQDTSSIDNLPVSVV